MTIIEQLREAIEYPEYVPLDVEYARGQLIETVALGPELARSLLTELEVAEQVKRDRDALLAACAAAFRRYDRMWFGDKTELTTSVRDEFSMLRNAINATRAGALAQESTDG